MGWEVVKRKLGRAGGLKKRLAQQREWDRQYGDDMWAVGYVVDGEFMLQETALESIYYKSYEQHFANHPEDLAELISLAKVLRNPHAEATTGVDLQVPAILSYLKRHNLELNGTELVDIGTWQNNYSHPLSVRLSPLQIKVVGSDKMTLEQFWQNKKCLAIWVEED